jgi:hypothetical protein
MSTTIEVRVNALLHVIGAALCAELEVAESESGITKPCLCTVLPGANVAYDYCEEGGMAWSRLFAITPVEVVNGNQCVIEYDVTVEVGVLRCAPGLGPDGELPTEPEQLAASMQQMFDMGVMHKALTCTPVAAYYSLAQMGPYTPIGPDGGCVGGTWTRTWRMA